MAKNLPSALWCANVPMAAIQTCGVRPSDAAACWRENRRVSWTQQPRGRDAEIPSGCRLALSGTHLSTSARGGGRAPNVLRRAPPPEGDLRRRRVHSASLSPSPLASVHRVLATTCGSAENLPVTSGLTPGGFAFPPSVATPT